MVLGMLAWSWRPAVQPRLTQFKPRRTVKEAPPCSACGLAEGHVGFLSQLHKPSCLSLFLSLFGNLLLAVHSSGPEDGDGPEAGG